MSPDYILAVDQGTSATKAIIFDAEGQPVARAAQQLESSYPHPDFVEQDPEQIYLSVIKSVKKCLENFREDHNETIQDITACGLSNQRETFLLWDDAGRPITNAVVWQCKRSVEICSRLRGSDLEEELKARTGLIADPYFSGTKLIWLYENDPSVKKAIDEGKA
ncbi:MAG TPA: FGGY family carbohydrate kinase, partial [bacterium]|nr:FGGY family carbohydrate kinase [bacterium]